MTTYPEWIFYPRRFYASTEALLVPPCRALGRLPVSDGMEDEQEKTVRFRALWQWLRLYGSSITLITTGLLFVAAAIWAVEGRQAVSTALVVFGAGMVFVGVLLPRIEGAVTISLQQGLSFTLVAVRATERRAAELRLSPTKTDVAVGMAIEAAIAQSVRPFGARMLSQRADALIAAPTADAIADAAIERVIDLDAAREERRRMGQDVDNEPRFADVQRKLESAEPLTPEEQAGLDRLLDSFKRFAERLPKDHGD